MVASCAILVGISYFMLDILSGMVVTPKTQVKEVTAEGTLSVPLEDTEVRSMQVSGDGRLLAYIGGQPKGSAVLRVVELGGGLRTAFSGEVDGAKLAWLGDTPYLVYEDGGDIQLLDVAQGASENLTASPAYDGNPIPSPDGRYILWTISQQGASESPDFWVMDADGSGKTLLAEAQALAVWDPAGGKVISRHDTALSAADDDYRYFLQIAVPGREGWEYYVECDGEVRFIWWPAQDTVLYLAPIPIKGQDMVKGIWYRAEPPDVLKKVASTDGLGYDEAYYRFYPAREEERLAYVGEKGLEYMDYEERIIYRYPDLGAEAPLAWDEVANELYYTGPEGIYRVALGGE